MRLEEFKSLLEGEDEDPPSGLDLPLTALWYAAKGNWERAHALVMEQTDGIGAWVHAYLHRVEGDNSNAAYWYRLAGKEASAARLADEWDEIAGAILQPDGDADA